MIYFDATFFVRLYLDEEGFEKIRQLAEETGSITSSVIGKMESEAAMHRHLRERRINVQVFQNAYRQFAHDQGEGFMNWLPLTPAIIERVHFSFLDLPADIFLRTGDAIHLATASEAGFKEIYSNDRRLLSAAPLFKLKGINPLAK